MSKKEVAMRVPVEKSVLVDQWKNALQVAQEALWEASGSDGLRSKKAGDNICAAILAVEVYKQLYPVKESQNEGIVPL